ncbi:type I restriction-modification system endonuclease [Nonlabens ulvanivorans]|uniref:type I restriction-modification system endonuclease n=1 Tax=Nonlabens ulvanivorans TaxID=906888 RepID=UPI002943A24C|nr:type I restriction-modification system endonuclease [Nonlabens ulvanivorans]WOI21630.1 type I restriction-modification system endonuclease [Nonlabens ulvanivorans]
MSYFNFLKDDYPKLFVIAELSEQLIHIDPSSSLSKTRLLAEKMSQLIWDFEQMGDFNGTQLDRLNRLAYSNILPEVIEGIFHTIRKSGNQASHDGTGSFDQAKFILKKAFKLSKWFYETYENDFLELAAYELPAVVDERAHELQGQLDFLEQQLQDYKAKIEELNSSKEVQETRKSRSNKSARNIDLNEHDTRILLIDPALKKAGWEVDTDLLNYKTHKTLPEKGRNMAIAEWYCDGKWADYALFIGTTLYGIVEAKRYRSDISTDLRQSKIYAERITDAQDTELLGKWNTYKVPFLFSTNGREFLEQLKTKSGIWHLDIRKKDNHAAALKGWFSPQGLVELYERDIDESNDRLEKSDYDYLADKTGLSLRDYQIDAIKKVEKKIIERPEEQRSLLVMATGTGKTRTVIGLSYRLIKSDRFKRILFLTDRTMLATQALGNYKENKIENLNSFGDVYQLEELKDTTPDGETRLHFATVQSMVKRLFYNEDPLPIDSYDCIIIDEAHRGYNLDKEIDEDDLSFKDQDDYVSQYKKVIEYFNAYIIGLTATPALHTTQIFGEPVFSYSYRQAVLDGHLIDYEPPYNIKTKLNSEGIVWKKGERPKAYNPETGKIEELAALDDELKFEIDQFNKLVITEPFNRAVIKQLVQIIDPESEEKTLIFAARDEHADLIVKIFKEEFDAIGCRVEQGTIEKITGKSYNPQELTTQFKNEKFPTIAVTVDLLTTGIDVPKITNLVFLRRVRSRILYEQMVGRATRKCDEINKEVFKIYDAVRLYEALEDFIQIRPVSDPRISFQQLAQEMEHIDNDDRAQRQMQKIIAKFQVKKRQIEKVDRNEELQYNAQGKTADELLNIFKNAQGSEVANIIKEYGSLWKFLDQKFTRPGMQMVADQEDEFIAMEQKFGEAQKPGDYIESFNHYIATHRNKVLAIKTILTSPNSLDRTSLKELKMMLDQDGFNERYLNAAWRQSKNEDIAADIVSYIRTAALGEALVSHEDRIKSAFAKVKETKNFNALQLKWLTRFEAQMLAETVLTKEDLDKEPFKSDGGFKRINQQFQEEVEQVIDSINNHLYTA